jgi:hypothetical protein
VPARLLALDAAEPFRRELHRHISKRAEAGDEQDDVAPRPEAAGLRRMHDQADIDEKEDDAERHGNLRKCFGPRRSGSVAQMIHKSRE